MLIGPFDHGVKKQITDTKRLFFHLVKLFDGKFFFRIFCMIKWIRTSGG